MTDEQILALIAKQNELLTSLAERVGAVAPPTAAKPTTAAATAAATADLDDITPTMSDAQKQLVLRAIRETGYYEQLKK